MSFVSIKLFDLFVRTVPNKRNKSPSRLPMATVFPHRPPSEHAPSKQTKLAIEQDELSEVFQALSSETAQAILGSLTDAPKTASDIADSIGQSVQSVSYHLDRLCDADVITPVDTWYSTKGREMTVYALTTERFIVKLRGEEDTTSRETDASIET